MELPLVWGKRPSRRYKTTKVKPYAFDVGEGKFAFSLSPSPSVSVSVNNK